MTFCRALAERLAPFDLALHHLVSHKPTSYGIYVLPVRCCRLVHSTALQRHAVKCDLGAWQFRLASWRERPSALGPARWRAVWGAAPLRWELARAALPLLAYRIAIGPSGSARYSSKHDSLIKERRIYCIKLYYIYHKIYFKIKNKLVHLQTTRGHTSESRGRTIST